MCVFPKAEGTILLYKITFCPSICRLKDWKEMKRARKADNERKLVETGRKVGIQDLTWIFLQEGDYLDNA